MCGPCYKSIGQSQDVEMGDRDGLEKSLIHFRQTLATWRLEAQTIKKWRTKEQLDLATACLKKAVVELSLVPSNDLEGEAEKHIRMFQLKLLTIAPPTTPEGTITEKWRDKYADSVTGSFYDYLKGNYGKLWQRALEMTDDQAKCKMKRTDQQANKKMNEEDRIEKQKKANGESAIRWAEEAKPGKGSRAATRRGALRVRNPDAAVALKNAKIARDLLRNSGKCKYNDKQTECIEVPGYVSNGFTKEQKFATIVDFVQAREAARTVMNNTHRKFQPDEAEQLPPLQTRVVEGVTAMLDKVNTAKPATCTGKQWKKVIARAKEDDSDGGWGWSLYMVKQCVKHDKSGAIINALKRIEDRGLAGEWSRQSGEMHTLSLLNLMAKDFTMTNFRPIVAAHWMRAGMTQVTAIGNKEFFNELVGPRECGIKPGGAETMIEATRIVMNKFARMNDEDPDNQDPIVWLKIDKRNAYPTLDREHQQLVFTSVAPTLSKQDQWMFAQPFRLRTRCGFELMSDNGVPQGDAMSSPKYMICENMSTNKCIAAAGEKCLYATGFADDTAYGIRATGTLSVLNCLNNQKETNGQELNWKKVEILCSDKRSIQVLEKYKRLGLLNEDVKVVHGFCGETLRSFIKVGELGKELASKYIRKKLIKYKKFLKDVEAVSRIEHDNVVHSTGYIIRATGCTQKTNYIVRTMPADEPETLQYASGADELLKETTERIYEVELDDTTWRQVKLKPLWSGWGISSPKENRFIQRAKNLALNEASINKKISYLGERFDAKWVFYKEAGRLALQQFAPYLEQSIESYDELWNAIIISIERRKNKEVETNDFVEIPRSRPKQQLIANVQVWKCMCTHKLTLEQLRQHVEWERVEKTLWQRKEHHDKEAHHHWQVLTSNAGPNQRWITNCPKPNETRDGTPKEGYAIENRSMKILFRRRFSIKIFNHPFKCNR